MKKIILTVAIIAGGMSTFALPNTILPVNSINIVVNDEFKEIAVDELPTTVTNAIEKDFASATISKAYVNESNQYKIELTIDGSNSTVYADKNGKWLDESSIGVKTMDKEKTMEKKSKESKMNDNSSSNVPVDNTDQ